jgi:hypothetical protein
VRGAAALGLLVAAACGGDISYSLDAGQDGPPAGADCASLLDYHGQPYQLGPDMPGVAEPVTLTTPIAGLRHRVSSSTSERSAFFMDCELALALLEAAPILSERGVVEVVDMGVYNYRCIGGGAPPDCPNGISQHAYARALDIAGYTTEDGTYYSVNDDWVINPDGEETCAAATAGDKDAFLHEIICAQKAAGIWNIVLTPNYNAAHRNHFHVDLTDGSDFIEHRPSREGGGPIIPAVDHGPDLH